VELRQLRYFIAVAEELHFRRAAERLYIAQPAVSEQIRKLEAELGVRLFDRDHRSVALTPAGAAMLEQARRVLRQAEAAQHAARDAGLHATTRLRIGYAPDALPAALPRALRGLATAAPRVDVALETGGMLDLIDAVRDRHLDAAVAGLPAPVDGLRALPLGGERMTAAVPVTDSHALAPALSIERLAAARLLVLPRTANPAFHNAVVALYREARLWPTLVELPEPGVELALLAVASGAGIALLPGSVKDRHASPGIRFVDVALSEPVFDYALLTHPQDDSLPTRALLRALTRSVERAEAPAAAHAPLTLAA
jgi:DNA-binding transcriptional LysR family regulator